VQGLQSMLIHAAIVLPRCARRLDPLHSRASVCPFPISTQLICHFTRYNSFPFPPLPPLPPSLISDAGKPETFCRHRAGLSSGNVNWKLCTTFTCFPVSREPDGASVGLGVYGLSMCGRSCTPVSASHSMSLFDRAPLVHAARQTSARMGCIV